MIKKKNHLTPDFYFFQHNGDDEEDSDEDDGGDARTENLAAMEVDAPSLNQNESVAGETSMKDDAQVDEEWTVVSSRRGKGRKN